MPDVDLRGVPATVNPAFLPLFSDPHPLVVLVGGANSSKSYSTAQKVIYKTLAEPGHRYLAIRKVKKDVRHSVYDALRKAALNWGVADLFKYNDTECTLKCLLNGNDILGVGLDDVSKLKSFDDPTDFWLDEADQATRDDVSQLRLRLRGAVTFPLQGTLSMNPINVKHWIKAEYFDRPKPDVLTHRSTYRDNRWVNPQSVSYMKSITDPYWRAVYVEGNWGVLGGAVFTNFVIEDFTEGEQDLENVCQGMDFGFTHAQAIVRAGFKDGELYAFDECYAKGMVNSEYMAFAADQFGTAMRGWELPADSASPDKIAEWESAGYRVTPAKKGPGSLAFGVEWLAGRRIHVHETRCPNLARELGSFHRAVDRAGDVTERYVEVNDDCIAALRYATEWLWAGPREMTPAAWSADDLGL